MALVRDNAVARFALTRDFYLSSDALRPYGNAELSFTRWSHARGVLAPASPDAPGSPWWRAVNERLLRDKAEARLLTDGVTGTASARSVEFWLDFIRTPSPGCWYRAHNASIVAGYLRYEELAATELQVERFMMNVALLRVLFTHTMLVRPRLALGPLAPLGPLLADPRRRGVRMFLDLGRSFPSAYPVTLPVEEAILDEHALARALDYGLIAPRLTAVYAYSAESLGEPRLTSLLDDGVPAYAWPRSDRAIWYTGNTGPHLRLIARATGVRLRWESRPSGRFLHRVSRMNPMNRMR